MVPVILVAGFLILLASQIVLFCHRHRSALLLLLLIFVAGYCLAKDPALTGQSLRDSLGLLARLSVGVLQALVRWNS